jgi:hypothetical protein
VTADRPHQLPARDPSRPQSVLTSGLLLAAWAAALLASVVFFTGGFAFVVGHVQVRAHSAIIPLIFAAAYLAAAWRRGTEPVTQALAEGWAMLERRAALFAIAVSMVATGVGFGWGTYVAGGPDSYCYLHQAEVLARGRLSEPQPLVRQVPWPKAAKTFTPVGHLPAASDQAALVPACPAGYPLLMAALFWIGGRSAMFAVVPIFGGLAVWLTFLLGRHVAGNVAGLVTAVLLAVSPAFLYQIVQPMTDVPAVAAWTAALVAALASSGRRPGLACGLLTGAALLIRPNLVPLAGVMACSVFLDRPFVATRVIRALAVFSAAVLPFMIVTLALNAAMHGSPLDSGYGRLSDLFTLEHVRGNISRYPVWLVETETPFVLLAFAAPFNRRLGRSREAWWLIAFALATFACYVPYTVWDAWWFLRFVLPAFPALLSLAAAVGVTGLARLSPGMRMAALAVFMTLLVGFEVATASTRAVFELRDLESRFRHAGEYVERRLPPNAIVFAVTESGSVRFYSGRPTVDWSALDPAWLDRAVDWLSAHGYRTYFLFEPDEEPLFRQQFAGASAYADLDWPPSAEIDQNVRIYGALDRAAYLQGAKIDTDIVLH